MDSSTHCETQERTNQQNPIIHPHHENSITPSTSHRRCGHCLRTRGPELRPLGCHVGPAIARPAGRLRAGQTFAPGALERAGPCPARNAGGRTGPGALSGRDAGDEIGSGQAAGPSAPAACACQPAAPFCCDRTGPFRQPPLTTVSTPSHYVFVSHLPCLVLRSAHARRSAAPAFLR